MGPLTRLYPVVRSLPLGGQYYKVAEFRLRDLAFLQSNLDEIEPDPLYEFQAVADTLKPRARHAALVAAYDKAEIGPAVYGQPRGNAYFSTPGGAALFLWVALRRKQRISSTEAARLFLQCTGAEFGQVWRTCHGVASRDALGRMLLPAPQGGGGPARTWPEMIDEVSQERHWTYKYIYSLTLTEWRSVRNGGRFPEVEIAVAGQDLAAVFTEQMRRYTGEGITDPGDGGSEPQPPPQPPDGDLPLP